MGVKHDFECNCRGDAAKPNRTSVITAPQQVIVHLKTPDYTARQHRFVVPTFREKAEAVRNLLARHADTLTRRRNCPCIVVSGCRDGWTTGREHGVRILPSRWQILVAVDVVLPRFVSLLRVTVEFGPSGVAGAHESRHFIGDRASAGEVLGHSRRWLTALSWDDAAECLSWADENQASTREMVAWRRMNLPDGSPDADDDADSEFPARGGNSDDPQADAQAEGFEAAEHAGEDDAEANDHFDEPDDDGKLPDSGNSRMPKVGAAGVLLGCRG